MLVRRVAASVDALALFGERGLLVQIVGGVKLRHIFRDDDAFGVLPWAVADAVARIDGLRPLRAEVGVPRPATCPCRGRERLAMLVGALEAAEVGALARSNTGDEEAHVRRLRLRAGVNPESKERDGCNNGAAGTCHDYPPEIRRRVMVNMRATVPIPPSAHA